MAATWLNVVLFVSQLGSLLLRTLAFADDPCESWGEAADSNTGKFCGWLRDVCEVSGLDSVRLGEFWHYGQKIRGLEAMRPIKRDEIFVCVPRKCWMQEETVPDDFRQITDRCSEDAKIALFLAEELTKGEASQWATYLKMFPTEGELKSFHPAYLEDEFSQDEFAKKLTTNNSYWQHWMAPIQRCWMMYRQGGGKADADLTYYAYVSVATRRFGFVGLTPLLDMANTESDDRLNVKAEWRDEELSPFCFKATKDIPIGTELVVSYGAQEKSAMLTFAIYGFASHHVQHNESKHDRPNRGPDEVDGCSNLYQANWDEIPDKKTKPIWYNYYSFAKMHCFTREHREDRSSWNLWGDEHSKRITLLTCVIGLGLGLIFFSRRRLTPELAERKQPVEAGQKKKDEGEADDGRPSASVENEAKRPKRSASPANRKEGDEADGIPRQRTQEKPQT